MRNSIFPLSPHPTLAELPSREKCYTEKPTHPEITPRFYPLTGTRFRFYDTTLGGTNTCFPTVCNQCGERDAPAHSLRHANVAQVLVKPEEIVEFLTQLAITSNVINPQISVPLLPSASHEIELDLDAPSSETSSEDLSFDF